MFFGLIRRKKKKKFYFQNGLVRGTFLVLDHMSKQNCGKGGTIVNIASIVGVSDKFIPGLVYSGTKHAVIGFSSALKVYGIKLMKLRKYTFSCNANYKSID